MMVVPAPGIFFKGGEGGGTPPLNFILTNERKAKNIML